MKVSVFGIPDFPFGKKILPDPRLDTLKELYRSQKTTPISVEFVTEKDLKTADAIVCPSEKKLDLIILDMEIVEGKLQRDTAAQEKALLGRAQGCLEKEDPLCAADFSGEERQWLANNNFVTIKPVVVIERQELDALPLLTQKVYAAAGRISFLTGGAKESRAWEIGKNAAAVEAADAIHSDIARGFIRAEVMGYEDLVKIGNVNQAKSTCLRQEGKDYVVRDGDIMEFKFSV